MRISFILSKIAISGGAKAVFEFANHLHDRGHEVHVIYARFTPLASGIKWHNLRDSTYRARQAIKGLMRPNRVEWFDLKANLIRVPVLAERYVPDADIVVATWWETAYYVNKYSESKGEKFYLAQHYETWGGPEEEVNNTYRLGLRIVVNSIWLENILREKLNVNIEALIPHAPDWEQFYPEPEKKNNSETIRILMPYRKEDWKGARDGISAFEIAKKSFPNIQLIMFGPPSPEDLPRHVEYHERPSNSELRRIYNSCDIFLFPSWIEGFGMPPMEAMACKVPVVTTNVGAVPEYAIPGETALVSPPKSPGLLADNLKRLIQDSKLRTRIAEAGHNYIKKFTWEKATEELEQVFIRGRE